MPAAAWHGATAAPGDEDNGGGGGEASPAVAAVAWSPHRPCVFFVLDAAGRAHAWDLAAGDARAAASHNVLPADAAGGPGATANGYDQFGRPVARDVSMDVSGGAGRHAALAVAVGGASSSVTVLRLARRWVKPVGGSVQAEAALLRAYLAGGSTGLEDAAPAVHARHRSGGGGGEGKQDDKK